MGFAGSELVQLDCKHLGGSQKMFAALEILWAPRSLFRVHPSFPTVINLFSSFPLTFRSFLPPFSVLRSGAKVASSCWWTCWTTG